MMTTETYIGIIKGGNTLLSNIIDVFISMRTKAKTNGDQITAWAFKILLVSAYGAMGSKHGIISSKTCAEATTCAAMFFPRRMISIATDSGYKVVYGDTDSIFV